MSSARPLPPAAIDVDTVMYEARQRFIARFPGRCESLTLLIEKVASLGEEGPAAALLDIVHRLNGMAGTVGFADVSARAGELEDLLRAGAPANFNPALARDLVEAMRQAFAAQLSTTDAAGAAPVARAGAIRVLIAEADAVVRARVVDGLERAGYVTISVASGDLVVETARCQHPGVILLDVDVPDLDGHAVCRLLKADPELADTPVILMATNPPDAGFGGRMLGADEFLQKPVDMQEFTLRMHRLLAARREMTPKSARPPNASGPREFSYDVFLELLRTAAAGGPAALAMVRVTPGHQSEVSALLSARFRDRDAICVYGPTCLLILMPEMAANTAASRLAAAIDLALGNGKGPLSAGVATTEGAGSKTAETLIAEADDALAEARYLGQKAVLWSGESGRAAAANASTVLLADDDPEVTAIVDAQMRAAGYQTLIAFDGDRALAAVEAKTPDVLVLDLMLPKVTGFEILAHLQTMPVRPRVLVLSARGREDDVTRAFGLGADDYMTKPFSPRELMARVGRLMR